VTALPDAEAQYPRCGACGRETDYDGDNFCCYDCGLGFDTDDMTAFYLDPDLDACGHPCDNTWHRPDAIEVGRGYECQPCALPRGHKSVHWTACEVVLSAGVVSR
jgi:hypothetical protein